jgi:hypothetical protein
MTSVVLSVVLSVCANSAASYLADGALGGLSPCNLTVLEIGSAERLVCEGSPGSANNSGFCHRIRRTSLADDL